MVPISDENCKPFWSMFSGRMTEIPPPSPLLSKDEGLRDIEHIMSIGNLILGVNSVTVSYLIHYDSLLQNATDIITKCDSYFITKCDRSLLQNSSGFLLQHAIVITKCDNFLTKCESYYKMGRLLEVATVHSKTLQNYEVIFSHIY